MSFLCVRHYQFYTKSAIARVNNYFQLFAVANPLISLSLSTYLSLLSTASLHPTNKQKLLLAAAAQRACDVHFIQMNQSGMHKNPIKTQMWSILNAVLIPLMVSFMREFFFLLKCKLYSSSLLNALIVG